MFSALQSELAANGTVQFYVRARPGMPKTKATQVMDDESIKIDIAAAPEGGKANAALVKYLEKEFGGNVQIISGATARMKLVRVSS
ncbi:MAG: DUF167 domain-containing protein [Candidatus Peregrinibacteria bacterium]|nr:DUF167 domain-containing protein [Candidatus Peregrinibacteria bacterium]MCB9808104.1 DUF167 domain-containing protein [Candidatus Peribacteria bacterium]